MPSDYEMAVLEKLDRIAEALEDLGHHTKVLIGMLIALNYELPEGEDDGPALSKVQ